MVARLRKGKAVASAYTTPTATCGAVKIEPESSAPLAIAPARIASQRRKKRAPARKRNQPVPARRGECSRGGCVAGGPASSSMAIRKKKARGRPRKIGLLRGERLFNRFVHKVEGDASNFIRLNRCVRSHVGGSFPRNITIGNHYGVWGVKIDRDGDDVVTGEGWEAFAAEYAISPGDILLINVVWAKKWEIHVFGAKKWEIHVFGANDKDESCGRILMLT